MNPLSNRRGGREIVVMIPDPDRRRRMLRATAVTLAAAGVLWASLFSDQLAAALGPAIQVDLDTGQGGLAAPPAQAGTNPGLDLRPPADPTTTSPAPTTTTEAPPEETDEPAEQEAAQPEPAPQPTRPGNAYDEPEQAAQAWYAHRGHVPPDQVQVLQLDRGDHDTFTALVTTEKDARQHGALVEVVRVGGGYWRVSRLLQEG